MKKQIGMTERNEDNVKQQRKAHKDFRVQRKQRNNQWQALEA